MRKLGMYIHIPFCKSKCYYCDFCSYAGKEEQVSEYIKWLKEEIKDVAKGINNIEISTIYIGGGTPSYIDSSYIVEIMQEIKNGYILSENAEITIEVNPGTVDEKKLQDYKMAGINRISIGLQSTHNEMLKKIGRIHTFEEFLYTYQIARNIGFSNINVDLITGLPGETLQDVREDLERIITIKPEHISVYSLILEEGTKLYKQNVVLPSEEEERQMYWIVKDTLEKSGYKHYEISNFAKQGCESKHNLDCWHQKEYIGFGSAAHSYTDGCRYSNITDVEEYIKNWKGGIVENNFVIHEKQDKTAMAKEFILLALRTIQGCNLKEFEEKFGYELKKGFKEELAKLKKEELLEIEEEWIRLSAKGLDLANQVWEEFI